MARTKQPRDLELAIALVERPLSLDEAYVALQSSVTAAVRWYLNKKAVKRRWARTLRLMTLIAVVLGGLAPIVGTLLEGFPSSVGFVLLGLAAGLQLFDRAFAFSGGWSRSLSAAMALEACAAKLALEYSRLKSQSADDDSMWQLLIAASNEVWQIIASETATWQSEFQAALEDVRHHVAVPQGDNMAWKVGAADFSSARLQQTDSNVR